MLGQQEAAKKAATAATIASLIMFMCSSLCLLLLATGHHGRTLGNRLSGVYRAARQNAGAGDCFILVDRVPEVSSLRICRVVRFQSLIFKRG